jgi:hypothetical protein
MTRQKFEDSNFKEVLKMILFTFELTVPLLIVYLTSKALEKFSSTTLEITYSFFKKIKPEEKNELPKRK